MGCTSTIEETNESYPIYESIFFDYSQFEEEIFIQVQTNENIINEVDSVNVIIYEIIDQSENLIITEVKLFDDGFSNGDLISNNGVFTFLGDLQLNYTNHLINYKFYIDGEIHEYNEIKSIIEFIKPSIVNVEFYKTNINNEFIQLENNYSVDETDSSYFKFIVEIENPSGIEQISKIIYSISVNDIDATKCGDLYEPPYLITADEFVLEYNNSIGNSHFYTNINSAIEEPGMVIGSVVGYMDGNGDEHCAILGGVIFDIIIIDENFGNINKSYPINFVSCGEGFGDCE